MLESCNGKLFVCASSATGQKRLSPVRAAAEKTARRLKLSFEVKTFRKEFVPIYVYYKNGDEEPVPIYCVGEGHLSIAEICTTLTKMMFVLSFHPKNSTLRRVRDQILQFS